MRKLIPLFIVSVLSLAGCKGMIHVDAIERSVHDITARHDAYVQQDPALSEQAKAAFLLESRLFREVVDEAKK